MRIQHPKGKVALIASGLLAISIAVVLLVFNSEILGREWLLFRAAVGTTSSRISAMEQLSGYNEKRPIVRLIQLVSRDGNAEIKAAAFYAIVNRSQEEIRRYVVPALEELDVGLLKDFTLYLQREYGSESRRCGAISIDELGSKVHIQKILECIFSLEAVE
jgi:hypothetical protein